LLEGAERRPTLLDGADPLLAVESEIAVRVAATVPHT